MDMDEINYLSNTVSAIHAAPVMDGILKDHYLMFCAYTFKESEFLAWALSLDASDLALILEQFYDE